MLFFAVTEVVLAIENAKRTLAEEARLRSLPKDQQDFELRLREVKALEQIARKETIVNVRKSLF